MLSLRSSFFQAHRRKTVSIIKPTRGGVSAFDCWRVLPTRTLPNYLLKSPFRPMLLANQHATAPSSGVDILRSAQSWLRRSTYPSQPEASKTHWKSVVINESAAVPEQLGRFQIGSPACECRKRMILCVVYIESGDAMECLFLSRLYVRARKGLGSSRRTSPGFRV